MGFVDKNKPNCVTPIGLTQLTKKPRVRAASSESVVGLESSDLFAKHGVKGAALPCGAWGGTPPHKPNCVSPILSGIDLLLIGEQDVDGGIVGG